MAARALSAPTDSLCSHSRLRRGSLARERAREAQAEMYALCAARVGATPDMSMSFHSPSACSSWSARAHACIISANVTASGSLPLSRISSKACHASCSRPCLTYACTTAVFAGTSTTAPPSSISRRTAVTASGGSPAATCACISPVHTGALGATPARLISASTARAAAASPPLAQASTSAA